MWYTLRIWILCSIRKLRDEKLRKRLEQNLQRKGCASTGCLNVGSQTGPSSGFHAFNFIYVFAQARVSEASAFLTEFRWKVQPYMKHRRAWNASNRAGDISSAVVSASDWKVGCSKVTRHSIPWTRAFAATAPTKSIIQASACRQLLNKSVALHAIKKKKKILEYTASKAWGASETMIQCSVLLSASTFDDAPLRPTNPIQCQHYKFPVHRKSPALNTANNWRRVTTCY